MLKFNDKNHSYVFNDEPYKSVTTLIKEFEEKKDWNAIATGYAKKKGEDAQYWLDKWAESGKEAAQYGTLIHAHFENKTIENEVNVFQHETQDGIKIGIDLKNLVEGVYPELMLYSNRYKIAGQSDLIRIYSDKTFEIEDFKTDKEIKFEAGIFYNKEKKRALKAKYLFPLSHLDECSWNKYQVQLSIYAYILEGYGFKCKKLQINHVKTKRDENGKMMLDENNFPIIEDVEIHECQYLKAEAKAVLNTVLN